MENVEWKRIPGFPGYEVKAGECPQVRNRKSGRMLKAAPQLSLYRRGRVLVTSPARCLYAAERGISPEDLPEGKAFVGRPEQVLRSRLEAMAKRYAREASKI